MTSPASAPTLTCPQCGYVNESERVYCHNCGAKLDRSLLPKEDDEKTRESIDKTRKRVKKMTNPGGSSFTREFKTGVSVLLWAALVAAIILIARAPDGVPATSQELPTRLVSNDLADAVDSPQPRQLQFTEADVNAHLGSSFKSKVSGLPGMKFERAFVRFEPGVVRIGMKQSIAGYPIYYGSAYGLEIKEGKLVVTNVGGNFGRLAVHPMLMQYADAAFSKLWSALRREHEQVQKMRSIQIGKGYITLVSKGTGAK